MSIDPAVLSSVAAAAGVLGNDYLKGVASEAGKATWVRIKTLFGWTSDLREEDIREKLTAELTASPQKAGPLLDLLKGNDTGIGTAMVQKIEMVGGKLVIANSIVTDQFNM